MKSKIIQLKYLALAPAIILLLAMPKALVAQQAPLRLIPKLEALAKPLSTPGWIDFKEGTAISPTTIFTDLRDAFELSESDQMKLGKTENDNLGFTHYRYQQYYKNHKVLYAEYLVHQASDGFVSSANGKMVTGLQLGSTASVSEKQALAAAMASMNAKKYLWQNTEMEKELKRQQKANRLPTIQPASLCMRPKAVNLVSPHRIISWRGSLKFIQTIQR